jgi:hypothetical protein
MATVIERNKRALRFIDLPQKTGTSDPFFK